VPTPRPLAPTPTPLQNLPGGVPRPPPPPRYQSPSFIKDTPVMSTERSEWRHLIALQKKI
ncbi:MAG: hypothetical protein LBQ73_09300, partial [Tannerellaceae bacterium]|nr:hypothetical protein [Tannerellaceae bacterium]